MGATGPAKVSLRLPGAETPAEQPQEVVAFVLSGLRKRHFKKANQQLAAFNLSDVLEEMGFTKSEGVTLSQFLQKAGLLVRTSSKEGASYIWYVAPPEHASLPFEVLQAAWREMRTEINLRGEITRLNNRLEALKSVMNSASPEAELSEDFAAQLAEKVGAITTQRDEALTEAETLRGKVEALQGQVQELTRKLAEKPGFTTAQIMKWLDEKATPAPAKKSSKK